MDRSHWAEKLGTFNWLCGRCQAGRLRQSPDHSVAVMTGDTRAVFYEDWFDRDDGEARFAQLLICDNKACGDPVAVAGLSTSQFFQIGETEYDEVITYEVRAVTPAPLPFPLHDNVPEAVAERIRAASALVWSDHDAAGNKIRHAVEALLDDRRIKRSALSKPKAPAGKRSKTPLTLHARLELYGQQAPIAGEHLMAIKFIGNAGSHSGAQALSRDDVLDAFDIIEQVLEEIYVGHRARVAARARRIVAARKPLARRKTRP